MGDLVAGYAGALVAVFFFGTCYVPAKQYATYDGIIFQWFMCSGILMVGLTWGLVSNDWAKFAQAGLYAFPQGLLGGALFAAANLLIPTVVNTLGLGLGFMLWNATNLAMGYAITRFGLFGVAPTLPSDQVLSAFGIALMLAAIAVFGLIEPTLSPTPATPTMRLPTTRATSTSDETSPLVRKAHDTVTRHSAATESLQAALLHPELPNFGPFTLPPPQAGSEHVALIDAAAEQQRRAVGALLALLVGLLLSCCLVPYVRWQQACKPSPTAPCEPLDFVFSQCLGIYVASTLAFLLYSALHRFVLRRSMPRSVMRPAYMCGVLWALGLAGQLFAAGQLGFDQAYPVTAIGPAMVSMLWSACYFREIQGRRNLRLLTAATAMVCLGTALRVVSA